MLAEFSAARARCPAITKLLIPDEIWEQFQKTVAEEPDRAFHQSMLLLAFERGHLHRITAPVHRFLLQGGALVPNLNPSYKGALKERWLEQQTEIERHQKSRIYSGKLTELQIAQWLEAAGWNITNLEAWGGPADISATSPESTDHHIEVKFLGEDDDAFAAAMNQQGHWGSHYIACNYLLLRTFDAAKQLQYFAHNRLVVIVIDTHAWGPFFVPLSDDTHVPRARRWIDWASPTFFSGDTVDNEWLQFLQEQDEPLWPEVGSCQPTC